MQSPGSGPALPAAFLWQPPPPARRPRRIRRPIDLCHATVWKGVPEGESAGSGLRLQPSSKRDTAATRAYSGGGGGQPLTAPLSRLLAVHRALSAVHLARRCLRHAVASSPRAVQSSAWPSGWSSGPSRAISGHLWPSLAISGHLGSSRVISGHLGPSRARGRCGRRLAERAVADHQRRTLVVLRRRRVHRTQRWPASQVTPEYLG